MIKHYIKSVKDEFLFATGLSGIAANRLRYKEVSNLLDFDYKVFSQFGDDGIIDYLLSGLGKPKPNFLEIGVENYRESNTRFLYQRTNCTGVIVDCLPGLSSKVKAVLKDYFWKGTLIPIETFVTQDNISDIVHKSLDLGPIDLFSLDIDGVDYWIASSVLSECSPSLVVVEFNSYFGPDAKVTMPYTPNFSRTSYHSSNLLFGASLRAFVDLLSDHSYTFLGTNLFCNNAYFVHSSLTPQFSLRIPDTLDLSIFTANYAREGLDADGKFTYISSSKTLRSLASAQVVDLSNEPHTVPISSLFPNCL